MIYHCYLCKGDSLALEHPRVRDNADIRVLRCADCDLVFLDRIDHISSLFYEESGMHNSTDFSVEQLTDEELADKERRVSFLKDKVSGRAYLDFGCGTGTTAKALSAFASNTAVVELDRKLRNYAENKLGLRAFESIEKVEGEYDVISLFHVFEHLVDPREEIKKIARFLKKDGEIYIEVPSANDALMALYRSSAFKDFTYWSCHLYLFTPKTLTLLIQQAGLRISDMRQVQRYPLSNHLYWLSEGKPGGHKKWDFMNQIQLNDACAAALAEKGLCDTLLAKVTLA